MKKANNDSYYKSSFEDCPNQWTSGVWRPYFENSWPIDRLKMLIFGFFLARLPEIPIQEFGKGSNNL